MLRDTHFRTACSTSDGGQGCDLRTVQSAQAQRRLSRGGGPFGLQRRGRAPSVVVDLQLVRAVAASGRFTRSKSIRISSASGLRMDARHRATTPPRRALPPPPARRSSGSGGGGAGSVRQLALRFQSGGPAPAAAGPHLLPTGAPTAPSSTTPPRRRRRPPPLAAVLAIGRMARAAPAAVATAVGAHDHARSMIRVEADGEPEVLFPGSENTAGEEDGLTGRVVGELGGDRRKTWLRWLATGLSALIMVGLLTSMLLSVLWGTVYSNTCNGRSCSSCATEPSCTWCAGPERAMPGYCEENTLTSDSSCDTTPATTKCTDEDEREAHWAACGEITGQQYCEGSGSGCEWCGENSTQLACVPIAANASFCHVHKLLFAERPSALTMASPACLEDGRGDVRQTAAAPLNSPHSSSSGCVQSLNIRHAGRPIAAHIDRSGELAKVHAQAFEMLAMNNSYVEGLDCVWVVECPFNTSVEVHFKQVNIGQADSLRVYDGWDTSLVSQLAYFQVRQSRHSHLPVAFDRAASDEQCPAAHVRLPAAACRTSVATVRASCKEAMRRALLAGHRPVFFSQVRRY